MTVPFDPMLTKEKDVIPDVVYTIAGDDSGAIVDKDNQVNAYSYGPHLVPISGILEQGSKILEEKNFKLLGFVDKSKVPRHCLMGEVDIVVPNEDVVGRKLFTSFVYSMLALNRYAIARYVPRTLKNGISPKLTVLIPYRST